MKNNLIPKKQQIRGCGNLLLATALALGCGVIDRYRGLSMNAGATWKHSGLHPPLWGVQHFPLNISLGPAVLLQSVSPAPASWGTGLSLVVSRDWSVGLPFWFPTRQLSPKVEVYNWRLCCPTYPNVCAVLLSLLFQKCRQPLKEVEKWDKMIKKSTFIASQGEIQPWSNYFKNQILSNLSVAWQSLVKWKSLSSQSLLRVELWMN